MGRVEAEVDEKGDGHSILEPLHHVGLAVQGVGNVASQGDVLSCTCRDELGLLSHSVGTWGKSRKKAEWSGKVTIQGYLQNAVERKIWWKDNNETESTSKRTRYF